MDSADRIEAARLHAIEDAKVEEELARQRGRAVSNDAGGWNGLAAELFTLHRRAYPAPWCWEQCGDKCDDPVIGAAWWDDDDDCTPIAGEVIAPADNVDRGLYREAIALEMQSHADGSAQANAALIVWMRNHVTEILNALTALTTAHKARDEALEEVRRLEDENRDLRREQIALVEAAGGELKVPHEVLNDLPSLELIKCRFPEDMTVRYKTRSLKGAAK